ncbi:MAG: substrate-binding domain-containing protein [Alphaproteobacteria bacterium]|nr:substrate-binding domain-containing protein [Alphaproteobacteria bacterium]
MTIFRYSALCIRRATKTFWSDILSRFAALAQLASHCQNNKCRSGSGGRIVIAHRHGKTDKVRRAEHRHNVTIRDVAGTLDLSITTVSRALGGYSDVGAETRRRVVEAARRLGYRPNRNAQRLVTRRTNVLAWIQSDNDRIFVDPHFVEVLAGVIRSAREAKYDVILTSDTPERQISVYDRYVRDNSVDGFVLDLPRLDDKRIEFLIENGRPFVVHGRGHGSARYNWVDIDNFGIFRALARLMIDNGHTRIAFVNGDEQYAFAADRRRGVEAALDMLGLPPDTVRIYNTSHPMGESGYDMTARALEEVAPSAILYSSALMAVEAQAALIKAGHVIGETIAIASMDDRLHHLDLAPLDGRITLARSSLREAGRILATELIRACEGADEARGVIVPVEFVLADGFDGSRLLPVEGRR